MLIHFVKYEVFRMVLLRIQILWDVMLFHWVSGTTHPSNTLSHPRIPEFLSALFHLCGTCESLSINKYYMQVICLSFQTLPDQQHCYFMTESKNLEGILVSNIPFSHPAHVPQILVLLRQQALFNVLVSSCIRSASKHGMF